MSFLEAMRSTPKNTTKQAVEATPKKFGPCHLWLLFLALSVEKSDFLTVGHHMSSCFGDGVGK